MATLNILDRVPTEAFFTRGVGTHKEKLTSFEMALRMAKIAHLNLVNVSSIFPPQCHLIKREDGLESLPPGKVTFAVIARNETNEPNRVLAAAIGLARPRDPKLYGYLSEHHSYGETAKKAGDYAEDLAATMLATTLGIPFDLNLAWCEREQVYRMSKQIVGSKSIVQSARGHRDGIWTTVVAACVFLA